MQKNLITNIAKIKNLSDGITLLPIIIFPLFPLFAVLFFVLVIVSKKEIRKETYYLFFLILSLYLGLINSTKVPQSDLISYIDAFNAVGNFSFLKYIFVMGKEPLFFVFNYLCYYLLVGNVHMYILLVTFISYFLFFVAIFKYYKAVFDRNNILLFSIILAAFFPQLFSLSAHLIRQFLAASLLFYAMVQKLFYGKKVLFLLLMAGLIHSTAFFFIPLLYFKPIKKIISLKTTLVLITVGIVSVISLPLITDLLLHAMGDNFITYVFLRASSGKSFPLKPMPVIAFVLLFVLVFISIYRLYINRNFIDVKGLTHFLNVFLLLSLFILLNLNKVEMADRFFFYVYFFLPFIFTLFFISGKLEYKGLRVLMAFFVFLFFIYKLQFGTWHYAPLSQLLFGNVFGYFNVKILL